MSEDVRPQPDAEDAPGQPPQVASGPEDPSKRKFITMATHAMGACVTCAVAVPPLAVVIHPLLASKDETTSDGFVPVASVNRFKAGGPFVRVVVKQDRSDAWLKTPGVPVGSILVKRSKDDAFKVFSAKCPHLGCAVNPVPGEERFMCPCHNSAFGADGTKLDKEDGSTNPAPRGLDALQHRVVGGVLQVQYVNYKTGTADQVAIG